MIKCNYDEVLLYLVHHCQGYLYQLFCFTLLIIFFFPHLCWLSLIPFFTACLLTLTSLNLRRCEERHFALKNVSKEEIMENFTFLKPSNFPFSFLIDFTPSVPPDTIYKYNNVRLSVIH